MSRWFSACLAIALSISPRICLAGATAATCDTIQIADTLWPAADGYYYDEWTNYGGAFGWFDAVDDQSSDGDTTYLYCGFGSAGYKQTFTMSVFRPEGLVDAGGTNTVVDSARMVYSTRKSGGTATPKLAMLRREASTDYLTDTVSVTSTSYSDQTGSNASYTVAQINASGWGLQVTTAPSVAQTIRVTQLRLIIYYKRVRCYKTIKANLRDSYMSSANPSANYGGDTVLYMGQDNSGSYNRIVIHMDSSDAKSDYTGWVVDTARLYLKTAAVAGGTHKLWAYSGLGKQVYAGTSTGGIETGAASWEANQQNIEMWGLPGADESEVIDDGIDRCSEVMDSASVTMVSTWYSVDVRSWFSRVQPAYVAGTLPSLPIIVNQKSEVSGDSTVRFASEDNGTSGNRPYIYLSYHPLAGFVGGVPAPGAASVDSIVFSGDSATGLGDVWTMGMRKDAGVTTYDTKTLGYKNKTGSAVNYWGLRKDWATAATSTSWTKGSWAGDILYWKDTYKVLSYYGIGSRGNHPNYIDSVVEYVKVMDKSGSGTVQIRIRGPLLQRPVPGQALLWASTAIDSVMNVNDMRDSIYWKTRMASGKVTGKTGVSAADWDTLNHYNAPASADTSRWDVGDYSDIIYLNAAIPAAGAWLAVNRTAALKAGLYARWRYELGGGAVDSIGFGDVFSWQNSAAATDTFTAAISTTRIRFGGVGASTTCCGAANAPRLVVYLNVSKTTLLAQQYGALGSGGFKQNYNWTRNRQRGAYGSIR